MGAMHIFPEWEAELHDLESSLCEYGPELKINEEGDMVFLHCAFNGATRPEIDINDLDKYLDG